MTPRQRVLAAIHHQPPDRVPVDIGASYATGLTVSAYKKVRDELGLGRGRIRVVDPVQMLAEVERPVIEALGADVIGLYVGGGALHGWQDWTTPDGVEVEMPGDIELRRRPDGGWNQHRPGTPGLIMPPGGFYFDSLEHPQWPCPDPDAITDEMLKDLEIRARHCHESTDLAVFFNGPWAISNSTSADFMCDLLLEKDRSHERLGEWADAVVHAVARVVDAVKGCVQVIAFSGDAGAQDRALFGPELYREMILPHMRTIPETVHRNSDIKCFLHSCGSVHELIDCFIDMGMDILNPLQLSAANMEPERLVQAFGGRIVFWGGGCDTQHVLPHGSADEVRRHVRETVREFSTVPGFVFSQVHNIQPDVPVQNILAMVEQVARPKFEGRPTPRR